jgi:dinuclear metal center YbgI/SA1388 family protein
MKTTRQILLALLNETLEPSRFKDYGPNGLQVEGRQEVKHLVTGVTASEAFIRQALDVGGDALLVHHGLFWRGQSGVVTGWMRRRLGLLLNADVSLFAYHLPLDDHELLGNNAQLALQFGWKLEAKFGDQSLGSIGRLSDQGALTFDHFQQRMADVLQRPVTAVGDSMKPIRRVAWCTGGAQSYFEAAIEAGADVFVTGEISEPQTHYARESGVAFVACGHHATERYGVQALGRSLAARLGIRHTFIDIDNPA